MNLAQLPRRFSQKMQSAELRYFESAIRDAIAQEAIEPCVPSTEALLLRAAMQGILGRARLRDDPAELSDLRTLLTTLWRVKPAGRARVFPQNEQCYEAI